MALPPAAPVARRQLARLRPACHLCTVPRPPDRLRGHRAATAATARLRVDLRRERHADTDSDAFSCAFNGAESKPDADAGCCRHLCACRSRRDRCRASALAAARDSLSVAAEFPRSARRPCSVWWRLPGSLSRKARSRWSRLLAAQPDLRSGDANCLLRIGGRGQRPSIAMILTVLFTPCLQGIDGSNSSPMWPSALRR